jgi:O-Antigen ligase
MALSTSAQPESTARSAGRGRALLVAPLLLVAWGALAFGAVYRWAYYPLAVASAVVGLIAIRASRRQLDTWSSARGLLIALSAVAVAAALQLIPLPEGVRATLSPASGPLLSDVDLSYAMQHLLAANQSVAPPLHALSIDPAATLRGFGLLFGFGILLVGLVAVFSRYGVSWVVQGLIAFGVALALIGIVQKALLGDHAFGGMKIYGFWAPEHKVSTPFGPYVNKNHYAGWMVMALPVALSYFLAQADWALTHVRRNWRTRLLWLSSPEGGRFQLAAFAVIVMGVALTMTTSRSGIACFVVAMAVGMLVAARRQATMRSKLAIVGALVALLVTPLVWAKVDLGRRFATPTDQSLQLRREVWSDTARVIRQFPLTGTGLNTFSTSMLGYQTARTDMHFQEAHNDYLQIAAEGGVLLGVPAAIAVLMLIVAIRRRFKERRDDPVTWWLRLGAATGLAAIALQSIVEFSLQMPGNAVLFVVLAAIALHRAPEADVTVRPGKRSSRPSLSAA